ncbi:6-hydroxymethylpterin diphosphokinase MptE-like protein [Halothiobacillus sp. DCM-1]|uniref:6-hydroxymethylpterin diphosphokinase MptE-like protein n=1 Tax=Halothiobacillus sp. DCM-1 TaxID=3112558 RepID=UPI00324C726E
MTDTHFELTDDTALSLVQSSHGDWIFPALNGVHFASTQENGQQSPAQAILQQHFGQRLHAQDRLYLLIGSDSGQLIRFVQSQAPLPRGSRWVFIEPPAIAEILRAFPPIAELLDDFVQLMTPEEWENAQELMQLDAYLRIGGVVFEQSLAALDHTTNHYQALTGALDAELSSQRYMITANLGKLPFIRAQLGNLPNFFQSLLPLKNLFAGKTALILAGGPSLDQEIDWIIRHRAQLFLIAVSRISARLRQLDITPDFVVTVDPHPVSFTVSRQMFEFDERTILVAGNHAYPGIVNRWPHRLLYTDELLPWTESPNAEEPPLNVPGNLISAGPTVTHTCVTLAAYLGFTTIAFAGLDLCHAANGQTHAKGSSEAAAGPLLDYTAVAVTTNQGESAWTTPDYYAGITAMATLAKFFAPQGVTLVNPSAQGARIDGVIHRPLAELDWGEAPFDRHAMDQALTVDPTQLRDHLQRRKQAIETMREDIHKISRLAQLGQESNRAFFHMVNPARQALHRRRMRAIDRLMRHRYAAAEQLVKAAVQHILVATDLPNDFFALDPSQAEALGRQFYEGILHGAAEITRLLPTIESRLDTRLAELDPNEPATALLARYEAFDEPERVLWLSKARGLSPSVTASTEARYQQMLDELLAADRQRNQEKRAPKASLRLAELHFSQKNRAAVHTLEQALRQHPEPTEANRYANYALGLMYELDQHWPEALAAYTAVLNEGNPQTDSVLLEHTLLRAASASLMVHDTAQASQALSTAALINPSHWPLVARLAELRQDLPSAIDAYTQYLARFPGDATNLRALARLFFQLGSAEGIHQCRALIPLCPDAAQASLAQELDALLRALQPAS